MIGSKTIVSYNSTQTNFYPASSVKLFVAGFYFQNRLTNERNWNKLRNLIVYSHNKPFTPLVKYIGPKKLTNHARFVSGTDCNIVRCLCRGNRSSLKGLAAYLKWSLKFPELKRWLRKASRRQEKYIREIFPTAQVFGKAGHVVTLWAIENLLIKRKGKPDISIAIAVKYSSVGCYKNYRCMKNYIQGLVTGLLHNQKL